MATKALVAKPNPGPREPRSLRSAPSPTKMLAGLRREFRDLANPERAASSAWFFRTGPGEYGEGDKFLGLTVPLQRELAARYAALPLPSIASLLRSPYHEHRLTALLILVGQYRRSDVSTRKGIFDFYVDNRQWVNNWDLVDSSAPYIVGDHLAARSRRILYQWAGSESLWERRIAIVSTAVFIKRGDLADTFALAERLLSDEHDLIHKAVGWMLREAGKRDEDALRQFLETHTLSCRGPCSGMRLSAGRKRSETPPYKASFVKQR
jgi:3-methyladenine DNA glycosylase AlkD